MNMREAANDRISNLPDSLLHHILSFLRINHGARTSVLSKRWNYIWTTVPSLDFRNWNFGDFEDPTSETYNKFIDFVDGTLHRHNSSNIDKFSLHWNVHSRENTLFVKNRVHSWISTVIRGNVKNLSLWLYIRDPWFIPLSLFTSASLTSLQLHTHPSILLPKHISLTRLKRLELHRFEFSNDSWNEELFSNSTLLEELILEYCIFHMRGFCISIPTLKLLKFTNGYREENGVRDCVFEINAPKLVTLSYTGSVAKELVLSSFPALAKANVYFNFPLIGAKEISRLLRALAHVKCLTVCEKTIQAICSACNQSNNLLAFHNVKLLSISDSITNDQGLVALLRAVPNLESLIFVKYMNDDIEEDTDEDNESDSVEDDENDSDEDNENDSDDAQGDGDNDNEDDENDSAEICSDEAQGDGDNDNEDNDADSVESENNHENEAEGDVAYKCGSNDECEDNNDNEDDRWELNIVTNGCLFPHLKSVCFQQFVGNPREMKWVRRILRDAKALQIMTIRYGGSHYRFANARSEKEIMVEIPSFPRASPGCVFKFCSRG